MKLSSSILFLAAAAVAGLAGATPAHASVILVTSAGALGANDSIDWSQLGPAITDLTSPQSVVSSGGLGATVRSSGGVFQRVDQDNGWIGNFAPGTPLLSDADAGPEIVVSFASPVRGAGAQIQPDSIGPFTAQIIASNGGVLGDFTENGNSNANDDNSAIFIGALSSTANIAAIQFDITAAFNSPNFFVIGPVALNTALSIVPEPASLELLGFGLMGLAMARRIAG